MRLNTRTLVLALLVGILGAGASVLTLPAWAQDEGTDEVVEQPSPQTDDEGGATDESTDDESDQGDEGAEEGGATD